MHSFIYKRIHIYTMYVCSNLSKYFCLVRNIEICYWSLRCWRLCAWYMYDRRCPHHWRDKQGACFCIVFYFAFIYVDCIVLQVYKKEKHLKKGIAFPTCLSINNCVCHFSPAKNDPDNTLKNGDVVKMYVDLYVRVRLCVNYNYLYS